MLDVSRLKVTRHALERLEQHYPGITWRAAQGLAARSTVLDDAVRPLLGRGPKRPDQAPSVYLLPPERKGLLVVEPHRDNSAPTVVTYLRLEASQQAAIERLWPRTRTAEETA